MPIEFQKWIKRSDLRENPNKLYVFGDNMVRLGHGGQAAAMRGELNAVGIPTKWSPTRFLEDDDLLEVILRWQDSFHYLGKQLAKNKTIVWPSDGIGTGLADLANTAPLCWRVLGMFKSRFFKLGETKHEDTN